MKRITLALLVLTCVGCSQDYYEWPSDTPDTKPTPIYRVNQERPRVNPPAAIRQETGSQTEVALVFMPRSLPFLGGRVDTRWQITGERLTEAERQPTIWLLSLTGKESDTPTRMAKTMLSSSNGLAAQDEDVE